MGWVYEYALVDRSGKHDLSQLRGLQDWFLKYELRTVPGVSEVASVGGMVKQYQIVVDPAKLRAYRLTLPDVRMAVEKANQEAGGSVIEMAEAEYMIRARGYLQSLNDLRAIPLGVTSDGSAIRLQQIAEIRLGPELRRGITELNGEGEVAGGIIVMRHGKNALATIAAVKAKLDSLQQQTAGRRRDRHHLRPLQAHSARDPQPDRHADRGIYYCRTRVPRVPVSSALGARRRKP